MNRTNVEIRDARVDDAEAMAKVTIEGWRTELRGLLPDAVLAARSAAESARNWRRSIHEIAAGLSPGEFILIAEDEAAVVCGLAMAGPERTSDPQYPAEVYIMHVDDAHRRTGVGRLLFAAAGARLRASGHRAMLIRVLAANAPARRFYEAMGGRLLPSLRQVEEEGVMIDETAYGWDNLDALAMTDSAPIAATDPRAT
jgi:GNAT superfamily N-acetyltransferase